ncbi:hypothetical protein FH972_020971 [Carpinus fangiana]|uniref:Chromo domain-containing protein n=1 Tax=Carpinus fangiana TaxID=176857 RepID=A0A5N6KNL5_9ROSI|nr:hypothetical protein FH972_020971 [Carpinus fangiana]
MARVSQGRDSGLFVEDDSSDEEATNIQHAMRRVKLANTGHNSLNNASSIVQLTDKPSVTRLAKRTGTQRMPGLSSGKGRATNQETSSTTKPLHGNIPKQADGAAQCVPSAVIVNCAPSVKTTRAASLKRTASEHVSPESRAKKARKSNSPDHLIKRKKTRNDFKQTADGINNKSSIQFEAKSTTEETIEERQARLLAMRNERVQKQGGEAVSTIPNSFIADHTDDTEEALPIDLSAIPTAEQRIERQYKRKEEAERKATARARAFSKAQRGRARPVATRVRNQKRPRKQPKTRPDTSSGYVNFGDDTSKSGSDSDVHVDRDDLHVDEEGYYSESFTVEAILQHGIDNGVMKYEIKWDGYDLDDTTWQTEEDLDDAQLILDEYKRNHMRAEGVRVPTAPLVAPVAPAPIAPTATTSMADSSSKESNRSSKSKPDRTAGHASGSGPSSSGSLVQYIGNLFKG